MPNDRKRLNRRNVLKLTGTGLASSLVVTSTAGATEDITLNEDEADKAAELIDELERADDPDKTFESFTEEEQEIITNYLSVTDVKVEPSTPILPANTGCLDVTATFHGENSLG